MHKSPVGNPAGDQDGTQASIYYPGHARFEAYDIIVVVWKGDSRQLYGYQLKEGSQASIGLAYVKVFDTSYLIRGAAAKGIKSIRLYQAIIDENLRPFLVFLEVNGLLSNGRL